MLKTWTVDEMLAEGPCLTYNNATLQRLWAGRDRLNLLDIANLWIPNCDIIWCACRKGALSDRHSEAFINRIMARVHDRAEWTVRNFILGCCDPGLEEWATRWLEGTREDTPTSWGSSDTACLTDYIVRRNRSAENFARNGDIWAVCYGAFDVAHYFNLLREENMEFPGTAERSQQVQDLIAVLTEENESNA